MNLSHFPRRSWRIVLNTAKTTCNLRALEVFHVPEICFEILLHCSWATLVSLVNVDTHLRDTVFYLFRRRIFNILKPFIENIENLFKLLQNIQGCIIGSTVWSIMTGISVNASRLNFAVPQWKRFEMDHLKSLLTIAGTNIVYDGPGGEDEKECVERRVDLQNKNVYSIFFFLLF